MVTLHHKHVSVQKSERAVVKAWTLTSLPLWVGWDGFWGVGRSNTQDFAHDLQVGWTPLSRGFQASLHIRGPQGVGSPPGSLIHRSG